MATYGHPLSFGALLPPPAAVTLAHRAEELGYDLVTVPDEPGGPDAWTQLTWIAGRTDRIRLAPHALDVTLREPPVLARSAASLDLLSGGRLDLALGADQLPGAALTEAIDI